MADIFMVKGKGGTMYPATQQDYEKIRCLKLGDVQKFKIEGSRNPAHHRKAWALINFIFENQNKYKNTTDLLVEIKLKAGHYEEHITTKGKVIYVPKSISFASMTQADFNIFYDKMIDIALQHFMQGMDESQIRQYVDGVLAYTC